MRGGAEVLHAIGNVDRLVAHALEVSVDADHSEDKAQIDGHGLFHRQQIERELIDLVLHAVDRRLRERDQLAEIHVA